MTEIRQVPDFRQLKGGTYYWLERTMVAITVDLKTKGLALRPGASLRCRAFMKFRGPLRP
jgi:hypothetical protein